MKYTRFTYQGGMPFSQDRLAEMQTAYLEIAAALANMAGNLAIISGCVDNGTSVTDGFVVINGELLKFIGGIKQDTVIIDEKITPLTYFTNQTNPTLADRTAKFGTGAPQWDWSDFKRFPQTIYTNDSEKGLFTDYNKYEGVEFVMEYALYALRGVGFIFVRVKNNTENLVDVSYYVPDKLKTDCKIVEAMNSIGSPGHGALVFYIDNEFSGRIPPKWEGYISFTIPL